MRKALFATANPQHRRLPERIFDQAQVISESTKKVESSSPISGKTVPD